MNRMTKIFAALATVAALAGCASASDTANDSNAAIETITVDGRTFECLVLVDGIGSHRVMGIDCRWPGEG